MAALAAAIGPVIDRHHLEGLDGVDAAGRRWDTAYRINDESY